MNSVLIAIGAFLLLVAYALAALNFYLFVLRYPLHRWRDGRDEDLQFISMVPLCGNLCTLLAVIIPYPVLIEPWVLRLSIVAFLCDLGGVPWIIIFLLLARLGVWKHR